MQFPLYKKIELMVGLLVILAFALFCYLVKQVHLLLQGTYTSIGIVVAGVVVGALLILFIYQLLGFVGSIAIEIYQLLVTFAKDKK